MKLEFEMSQKEAQQVLGRAIKEALAGAAAAGLEVSSVEWNNYGHWVTVTLQPPEPPETVSAERGDSE